MKTTQGAAPNHIMSTTQVPVQESNLRQSGKITAWHPNDLKFNSWTGHLGCAVRSCTLGCFHSCPRLKLTFTNIAKNKNQF